MNQEHKVFLKKIKRDKLIILITQIFLFVGFIISWEILAKYEIINTFIFSSPSLIIKTLINLYQDNNLFIHIWFTAYEVIISSLICFIISLIISMIFYYNDIIKKILDPFIILINSLPKVCLGPLLIIWLGAKTKTIIVNSLLINLIVTFTTILNGFMQVDKDQYKLFQIFGANKFTIIRKLIIPSSRKEIISALKIDISMSFIGVIMGEFLSCKQGIGYLILYGTQVFNLSLVMCGIFILLLLSFIFYLLINLLEKKLK